jgi:putative effector of murein hydrolase LrgA (UPF0299 family)
LFAAVKWRALYTRKIYVIVPFFGHVLRQLLAYGIRREDIGQIILFGIESIEVIKVGYVERGRGFPLEDSRCHDRR